MPETHDQLLKRLGCQFVTTAVQLFRGRLIWLPPKREVQKPDKEKTR